MALQDAIPLSNSWLRVLTAVVAAPVVVGLAWVGGWPFGLLVLGGTLLIQWEVYEMMDEGGGKPRRLLGMVLGALLVLRILVPALWPLVVVVVLVLIGHIPFEHVREEPLVSLADTVFGAVYPTALLGYVLQIRVAEGPDVTDDQAFWLTLSLFFLVWAADIFAYYVGKFFGRRALAPRVSPNKTWEGAAGGLAGSVAVAIVLRAVTFDFVGQSEPALAFLAWPNVIMLALICGILGPLGDLAESKLKRSVSIDDSGTILPGHGGLLDRFDAMIFAAPTVYLYLEYVAGGFS
ncbi:MAG: phosphatidate cytidylyltransferase [Bacteroidetes bacterium SW_4_67_19]|nr:MAG: phosphatidate cytidylyltransferase [Bacteroidetes bacterium SW_4_67_19]